ncbi:response regulator transcription factor [Pandoraea sp.]|uniref:response regulator transcription factor n=1 Tax=Pandoraea sp. TaxID=1883445 RepID=UPI0035B032E4
MGRGTASQQFKLEFGGWHYGWPSSAEFPGYLRARENDRIFCIPVHPPPPSQQAKRNPMDSPRPPNASPAAPEPVVYVVDDDEAVRVSMRWLLESVGHKVQVFANGREFLAGADPRGPGCVLLDIRMPYMGGFELQDKLQSAGFRLPIIFLTAHGDIPMTVRAMKGGAYDFLEKPFNDQELIDKVGDALQVGLREHAQAQASTQRRDLLKLLSVREREVFDLLIEGKASKVIAAELNISYKTVEVHRAHIRDKLGATSVAELVRLGMSESGKRSD